MRVINKTLTTTRHDEMNCAVLPFQLRYCNLATSIVDVVLQVLGCCQIDSLIKDPSGPECGSELALTDSVSTSSLVDCVYMYPIKTVARRL